MGRQRRGGRESLVGAGQCVGSPVDAYALHKCLRIVLRVGGGTCRPWRARCQGALTAGRSQPRRSHPPRTPARAPPPPLQVLGHSKTVLVLLGGWAFLGDTITAKKFAGMALAVGGMVWYGKASATQARIQQQQAQQQQRGGKPEGVGAAGVGGPSGGQQLAGGGGSDDEKAALLRNSSGAWVGVMGGWVGGWVFAGRRGCDTVCCSVVGGGPLAAALTHAALPCPALLCSSLLLPVGFATANLRVLVNAGVDPTLARKDVV